MTKPIKSFDQARRSIRRALHQKRLEENDHSEKRLFQDALQLDQTLEAQGFKLPYRSEWARFFNEQRHKERLLSASRKALESWQIDLNHQDIPKRREVWKK
jgi:fructosamine-3-kinase